MSDGFVKAGMGWLRRLWAGGPTPAPLEPGVESIAALVEAIGLLESRICEGLFYHGANPAKANLLNAFGRPVRVHYGASVAGNLASAAGMAMTGIRTAAFVDSDELAAGHALLRDAAHRFIPMVVHAAGSGHAGYHGVANAGFFQLMPSNLQEAVDFTLLARWLAEHALVPGLVATEGEPVGRLLMPTDTTIASFLGWNDDELVAPTGDQEILFGTGRRRMVKWFDPDHPVGSGFVHTDKHDAIRQIGRELYFWDYVKELAQTGMTALSELTGRPLSFVSNYGLDKADVVLVRQGAMVESARAVADYMASQEGPKIGVVAVTWLRPFPAAEIADALRGKRCVAVIERSDDPMGATPPLMREVTAAVEGNAAEYVSARLATRAPTPRLGRIAALCESLADGSAPRRFRLDEILPPTDTGFPRRDAVNQALRATHPELTHDPPPSVTAADATPEDQYSLAVVAREVDVPTDGLVNLAAGLAKAHGPAVRANVARPKPGIWEARIRVGDDDFPDPGGGAQVDAIVVDGRSTFDLGDDALAAIGQGGTLILVSKLEGDELREAVPPAWWRVVEDKKLEVRRITGGWTAWLKGLVAFIGDEEEGQPELVKAGSPTFGASDVPGSVRRIKRERSAPDSLPRFWGEVIQPERDGASQSVPYPLVSWGAVPAGASSLTPDSRTATLPALDGEACTGCGLCWTACPESAIGVTALTVEALLGGAAALAGVSGKEADGLKRSHKHLAGRMASQLKKADGNTFDEGIATDAFGWLLDKMSVAESERPGYQAAFTGTMGQMATLDPVVTSAFFHDVEAAAKGTGEMLVLAVNPATCLSCGLCVAACPDEALAEVAKTPELIGELREQWAAWENLPDTAGPTIARAESLPDVGSMGAVLLSKYSAQGQAGGGAHEAGSGERLAMRMVAAIAEEQGQKRLTSLAADLNKSRADLEERVSSLLAKSLAQADTAALATALSKVTKGKVPLSDLTSELDGLGKAITVDRKQVSGAAKLAGSLAQTAERITEGADGMGRARFGALIAGGSLAERLARFPEHPWWAPVTVELSVEGAHLARGIAEGMVADHVEVIRDLRRAAVHAEGPTDATARLGRIVHLTWAQLTDDERAACPPLLLVGDEASLVGRGFGAVSGLLGSDLPVKIVLLDGLGRLDDATSPALVAMAHRNAFVLAGSVAHPDHLGRGLRDAMRHPGPSLIHIHAPSPERHGFAVDGALVRAKMAVEGRAHVLLRYDPRAVGAFGARLTLDGNPELDGDAGANSFAQWAYGEIRFAPYFRIDTDGSALDTLTVGETVVSVAPAIVAAQKARLEVWNTLKELSGVLNPFAEQIRAATTDDLLAAHKAELDALRAEMKAKIEDARAGFEEDALSRLTDRLMTLSNQATTERG